MPRLKGVQATALAVAAVGFLLVMLAVHSGPTSGGSSAAKAPSVAVAPTASPSAQPSDAAGSSPSPPAHSGWQLPSYLFRVLVEFAGIVVLVTVIALLANLRSHRFERSRSARAPVREPEQGLDVFVAGAARAIDQALWTIRRGDVQHAIVACWVRLEDLAADVGVTRTPSNTSSELANRLLAEVRVSQEPVQRLEALYREARFSTHPMTGAAAAQAQADLLQIRRELWQ
jgi:hypothetical protein